MMNEIILVKPAINYAEQVMQFKSELIAANDADSFAGSPSWRITMITPHGWNALRARKIPTFFPKAPCLPARISP